MEGRAAHNLNYYEDGVRIYTCEAQVWTMIVRGKVGIVLCEEWVQVWSTNGAKVYAEGRRIAINNRVMGIDIPGQGWRRGVRPDSSIYAYFAVHGERSKGKVQR